MIVIDASLVVAGASGIGPDAEWARDVLHHPDKIAPSFIFVEAANALRSIERRGEIDRTNASLAYEATLELSIVGVPYKPCARRIWDLRENLPSYDAWYVAAAELAQVPLATLDRRLARATGPACEFLLPP